MDKNSSEKDRAEGQKTKLGPEVLDSEHHKEIVFKSTGAESTGQGQWTLHGNLILDGQDQRETDRLRDQASRKGWASKPKTKSKLTSTCA